MLRTLLIFAAGLLANVHTHSSAAEIKVLSANGVKLIMQDLAPRFERATGNKVIIGYGEAGILRKRVLEGERFDLVLLPSGWDEIRTKIAGSPTAVAHTDIGMAVLATAPKPDTSSNEGLKRTLLHAKSIVYTDPKSGGISGVLFARTIERLGIADEINKKSTLVTDVQNAALVANGEADLAVQLANEILAVRGVQFVSFPADFRASVVFAGAIAAEANEKTAAGALLRFLLTPEAAASIRSKGYEPG